MCSYTSDLSDTPPNEGIVELKVVVSGRKYKIDIFDENGTNICPDPDEGIFIKTNADASTGLEADRILEGDARSGEGESQVTMKRQVSQIRLERYLD